LETKGLESKELKTKGLEVEDEGIVAKRDDADTGRRNGPARRKKSLLSGCE